MNSVRVVTGVGCKALTNCKSVCNKSSTVEAHQPLYYADEVGGGRNLRCNYGVVGSSICWWAFIIFK